MASGYGFHYSHDDTRRVMVTTNANGTSSASAFFDRRAAALASGVLAESFSRCPPWLCRMDPCRHCPSSPPTKLRSQLRLYLLVCPMGVVQPLVGVLFLPHGLRGLPPLLLVHVPLLLASRAMAVGLHAHPVRGRGRARLFRRGQPRPLQPTLWRKRTLSKRSFASDTSWA